MHSTDSLRSGCRSRIYMYKPCRSRVLSIISKRLVRKSLDMFEEISNP